MNTHKSVKTMQQLPDIDNEIAQVILEEKNRQQENLILIASENLVSNAVLEAQGSILTNKYAEGYVDARYYGGCLYVDRAELLACERAKELFSAEHANVQPHSGASANMAVFLAVLKPGDRILGMDLNHGGHLSHGSKVNISGRHYEAYSYGVEQGSGLINLDDVKKKAHQYKPKLIIAGASAYPRQVDFEGFAKIAKEVSAVFLADMAHIAGLVAAGLHQNPVLFADIVTTTTHKTLRGPRGGVILSTKQYADQIDKAVFPGLQGGPLMHIIAAKAVAFKEAQQPDYLIYQQAVVKNAAVLAKSLINLGYDLITGGTDNHMVLVDLRNKNITGMEAEKLFETVNISVNKNVIPFDPRGAKHTSGIRLGTPTLTSRGMGPGQMDVVASLIDKTIAGRNDQEILDKVKKQVLDLCYQFPAY